jgi:hypothetical protein
VTGDDLGKLDGAVKAALPQIESAIASEATMRSVASGFGIDPTKPEIIGATMEKLKSKIDSKDLEILQIEKEQFDALAHDLRLLQTLAERAKNDIRNLADLRAAKPAEKEDWASVGDIAEEGYDMSIQVCKALLELASGPTGPAQAVFEILGSDAVKNNWKKAFDELGHEVSNVTEAFNKTVTILQKYTDNQTTAAKTQLAEVESLIQEDLNRYGKIAGRYYAKLQTILTQSGPGDDAQQIQHAVQTYKAIQSSAAALSGAKKLVGGSALGDQKWPPLMAPLGSMIFEAPFDPMVAGAYVVYQKGSAQNAFTETQTIRRARVEELAQAVARVADLDAAYGRVSAIAKDWEQKVTDSLGL